IPTEDEAASKTLLKSLKQKGIKVLLHHHVHEIHEVDQQKSIHVVNKNEQSKIIEADELLIAVGRRPNTDAFEQLQLTMNGQFVRVNEFLETSEKGIFAVGDIIGNLQLAHVASKIGRASCRERVKVTVGEGEVKEKDKNERVI